MKFLIQTKNNKLLHDFSFTLLNIIEYHNQMSNDMVYELYDYKNVLDYDKNNYYKNYIPIGSVEFVCDYIDYFYHKTVKPINVPQQLMDYKFTKRDIFNGNMNDVNNTNWYKSSKKFIKSNEKIKHITEICNYINIPGWFQISEVINILSEYRVFVFHGRIIGLKHYDGQFDIFPNMDIIHEMVKVYTKCPPAYTLDIAVTDKNDTVVIECHDFFSCGLYGFEHVNLPYMFSQAFYNIIRK